MRLQAALESRNWKAVDRVLSSLPSRLPKSSNSAVISASLEEVRAAIDALVQACDFCTAFESCFSTRKALIDKPSVLLWATESLKGFSFDQRILARIATMLGLLGMGSDGRAAVGQAGAVDHLTVLWSSHPTCVDIVRALVSLCSGHIDNVSRTMRRRGISVAVHVLSDENNKQDAPLIEQTLVYIGLCAICTPDTPREAKIVVPSLLEILEDHLNLRRPQLLRHVLMALGNLIDCWTKEGFGYHLGDEDRLVDAIIKAWRSLRWSKDIATASSWALGSMLVGKGTHRTALQCRLEEVKALAEPWKSEFKTCAFLYETTDQVTRKNTANLNEPGHQVVVARTADDNSNITGSSFEDCEAHVADTSLSSARRKRATAKRGDLQIEYKSEKPMEQSSSDVGSNFGNWLEVDSSPGPDSNMCSEDVSSTPCADHTVRKRQQKKRQKRNDKSSAKVNLTNSPVRKSKRLRTLSEKAAHHYGTSRRNRRLPDEVIVIPSDSDDECPSPKAVQDTCT